MEGGSVHARGAYVLIIIAFERFWIKNVKKGLDFPKNILKSYVFSLDVCKQYIKNIGFLSFGRDPLWEGRCKESLLWEGERAQGGEATP